MSVATLTDTGLVEAGLRAEIRLLGQLLAETRREHEGQDLYQLEESIASGCAIHTSIQ